MDTILQARTTPAIPKVALRALAELTGQVELVPAILITLKDAIEHRLSAIDAQIRVYESRYGMTFEQLQSCVRSGALPAPPAYRSA